MKRGPLGAAKGAHELRSRLSIPRLCDTRSRARDPAIFQQPSNYETTDAQAWYSNDATGVYFSFSLGHEDADNKGIEVVEPRDPNVVPVEFNMNYYRPHYFALEAEPEVRAFVDHFDLVVCDLQNNGMGLSEFTTEGFLTGWNTGNELATHALMQSEDTGVPLTLPKEILGRVWQWNFTRDARSQAQKEDVFVPRICLFDMQGTIKTGVIWEMPFRFSYRRSMWCLHREKISPRIAYSESPKISPSSQ